MTAQDHTDCGPGQEADCSTGLKQAWVVTLVGAQDQELAVSVRLTQWGSNMGTDRRLYEFGTETPQGPRGALYVGVDRISRGPTDRLLHWKY